MINKLYFVVLLLLTKFNFAQKQDNNWIFDDGVGINFSNLSTPLVFNTGLKSYGSESLASISDKNGNLLFHVNAADSLINFSNYDGLFSDIYTANHILMPNGDSIVGYNSATQGSLIIPFPDDSINYYVFGINANPVLTGYANGLYYSVVDMSLNNNLGDVSLKNIQIYNGYLTEKLTACKHGNGRDWWIIAHDYNNNRFIKFLITPSGISNPIYQNIGTIFSNNGTTGQMVFNKYGTRLALVGDPNIINIFNFDRCTGILSNFISIPATFTFFPNALYGCSISSNGNIIYISTADSLFQYNLVAPNILASKTLIWSDTNPYTYIGQHQYAPNNKIYIAGNYDAGGPPPNNSYVSFNMNLSVINEPDSVGTACNFTPLSFNLNGNRCMFGLPNMPNYNLNAYEGSPCDTLLALENLQNQFSNISIYPNPSKDFITINYKLASNQKVVFSLHNSIGQTILTKKLSSLYGTLKINTQNITEGIYFWQVKSENNSFQNGKIVLLK